MSKEIIIPDDIISSKIYLIRNQKVMLDTDLAELYQVETNSSKDRCAEILNASLMILCSSSAHRSLKT